jgi:hypothetical protein
MQETDVCTSLQASGFLLLFYTTLYTVAHARSTYIIKSLPITCTFSCNFRYYELSLFSRIKQPSCKFLSLLLCTPSCAKGKIQFGRAFSVLTWGHIISQNFLYNHFHNIEEKVHPGKFMQCVCRIRHRVF